MKHFLFAILMLSLLCACGQKGDLFLPEAAEPELSTTMATNRSPEPAA